MAKKESKYGEVVDFLSEKIKETSRPEDGREVRFSVSQGDYLEFMKGRGVPKEAIKQMADANHDYQNGNLVLAGETLIGDKKLDRVTINTRTPNGVISTRMTRAASVTNPSTGGKFTKYGIASIKLNQKSSIDREMLADISKQIEKACR